MPCPVSITPAQFKDYFDRGQFSYGATVPDIRDKDILAAIAQANAVFNCGIYPDDAAAEQALYYITAHFLTLDTDAAESGGGSVFIQSSRSADGISESNEIPEWMKRGIFAQYATTYYGQKYSMLTKPYLDGAVFVVGGATLP